MKNDTATKTENQFKIEVRSLRHNFTPQEKADIGASLAREIGTHRSVEADFDQVKADYKAKLAKIDAQINDLSTNLMNGFDIRPERCIVIFRPQDKKKDYYLESVVTEEGKLLIGEKPLATEDMTPQDFQAELIEAESKFEHREEIALFPPAEGDFGTLIVGKFGGKWFSALRIVIGKQKLEERLDSEQKSYKKRSDAVQRGGKRALDWLEETLKDHAKGFMDPIGNAIAAHLERVE